MHRRTVSLVVNFDLRRICTSRELAECLGQKSLRSKITAGTHRCTHSAGPTALAGH